MQKNNISRIVAVVTSLVVVAFLLMPVFRVGAAGMERESYGPWSVATAYSGSFYSGSYLEDIKSSGSLVVWIETFSNDSHTVNVFDGTAKTVVGTIDYGWKFTDSTETIMRESAKKHRQFDVADGVVVWVQNDGHDREIFKYDGGKVAQVSNNDYDDELPVVSDGRVAWTSRPNSSVYNLVTSDANGFRKLDSFHVLNYAFSGKNLYWLGKHSNDTFFRVFMDDGSRNYTVGEGDDTPNDRYFTTDGRGSAAWVYAPAKWNHGVQTVYLSYLGGNARKIIVREVPPYDLSIADVDGEYVALTSRVVTNPPVNSVSYIVTNGVSEQLLGQEVGLSGMSITDSGVIREAKPSVTGRLIAQKSGITATIIDRDVLARTFSADGDIVAGAVNDGVVITSQGLLTFIPRTKGSVQLQVKDGGVVWIELDETNLTFRIRLATRGLLVRTPSGVIAVNGSLVKLAGSPTVYLAGNDGKRYVFSGERQFYSWYSGFSGLRIVDAATLASMPLGGTVLYKPGSRLLKPASSSTVFTIDATGTIHGIANGRILDAVYGKDWVKRVDVIKDSEIALYPMGTVIGTTDAYYAALAK